MRIQKIKKQLQENKQSVKCCHRRKVPLICVKSCGSITAGTFLVPAIVAINLEVLSTTIVDDDKCPPDEELLSSEPEPVTGEPPSRGVMWGVSPVPAPALSLRSEPCTLLEPLSLVRKRADATELRKKGRGKEKTRMDGEYL